MNKQLVIVNESTTLDRALCLQTFLHGRVETTQRHYRCNLEPFFTWLDENKVRFDQATLPLLQSYMDSLADNVKHVRGTVLKSFFSTLKKMGVIQLDVACLLRIPKQAETIHERILTEDQVQRLINVQFPKDQKRNELILKLLYSSGMRVSELANSKWCNFVERDNDCSQVSIKGKGGKLRSLYLQPNITTMIKEWQKKNSTLSSEFMFTRPYDHQMPMTTKMVWRIVKEACRLAQVNEHTSPHWLRHANASHSLDAGCPIHVVQAQLGHSSLQTSGKYLHARVGQGTGEWLTV